MWSSSRIFGAIFIVSFSLSAIISLLLLHEFENSDLHNIYHSELTPSRLLFFRDDDLIGMNLRGGYVEFVKPGGQANAAGVAVGWRVVAVNGVLQNNDDKAIARAIKNAQKNGTKPDINIVFNISRRR